MGTTRDKGRSRSSGAGAFTPYAGGDEAPGLDLDDDRPGPADDADDAGGREQAAEAFEAAVPGNDGSSPDATRLYLSEIGFSPLLTAEEEVYYSRRARRGD